MALASTVGAQTDEGVKQVERVVKASGNTVKPIADTKLQPDATKLNERANDLIKSIGALRPQ